MPLSNQACPKSTRWPQGGAFYASQPSWNEARYPPSLRSKLQSVTYARVHISMSSKMWRGAQKYQRRRAPRQSGALHRESRRSKASFEYARSHAHLFAKRKAGSAAVFVTIVMPIINAIRRGHSVSNVSCKASSIPIARRTARATKRAFSGASAKSLLDPEELGGLEA